MADLLLPSFFFQMYSSRSPFSPHTNHTHKLRSPFNEASLGFEISSGLVLLPTPLCTESTAHTTVSALGCLTGGVALATENTPNASKMDCSSSWKVLRMPHRPLFPLLRFWKGGEFVWFCTHSIGVTLTLYI